MTMKSKFTLIFTLVLGLLFSGLSAQGQGTNCGEKIEGEYDTTKCREQMSIVYSYYKQRAFDEAYDAWRFTYCNCSKGEPTQEWIYLAGSQIMLSRLKGTPKDDKPTRALYYDSLITIYKQWMTVYPKTIGSSFASMGTYTLAYQSSSVERLKEAKGYFEKSFEADPEKISYSSVSYYLTTLQRIVKYKQLDTAVWIDGYFNMSDVVDKNLTEDNPKLEKWQKTRSDIDKMMEPVLQCDQLIPIYTKKLDEGGLTSEQLNKMVTIMKRKGCDDSETYERAATTLCSMEPTDACKEFLGDQAYKKTEYEKAKQFYLEAIELTEENTRKSELQLKIADCQIKMKAGGVMSIVNTAISLDPNNGKAYLLKAGLYVDIARNCSDAFDKKAGFWVVADMYAKAKSVDPSLADICNKKIATYSQYFPTKGEIFFQTDDAGNSLKIGNAYTVKCMGLSSTIRAKVE